MRLTIAKARDQANESSSFDKETLTGGHFNPFKVRHLLDLDPAMLFREVKIITRSEAKIIKCSDT